MPPPVSPCQLEAAKPENLDNRQGADGKVVAAQPQDRNAEDRRKECGETERRTTLPTSGTPVSAKSRPRIGASPKNAAVAKDGYPA